MVNVLFVCLGNICRSPTAEGVFAHLIQHEGLRDKIHTDSAGTYAYHIGEAPDQRAQEAAMRRGIDLSNQQARRVEDNDFFVFDYILAMDQSNYQDLLGVCPESLARKIKLFLDFAPGVEERGVPDPYYGGPSGFERVLDLIEQASHGLLADIRKQHHL